MSTPRRNLRTLVTALLGILALAAVIFLGFLAAPSVYQRARQAVVKWGHDIEAEGQAAAAKARAGQAVTVNEGSVAASVATINQSPCD
jgi:hypothetical protein